MLKEIKLQIKTTMMMKSGTMVYFFSSYDHAHIVAPVFLTHLVFAGAVATSVACTAGMF